MVDIIKKKKQCIHKHILITIDTPTNVFVVKIKSNQKLAMIILNTFTEIIINNFCR